MYEAFQCNEKLFVRVSKGILYRLLLCSLFLFVISLDLRAQDALPSFVGMDLNGKKINFSKSFEGRKTLVGFAFSAKVQSALQSWLEPVFYELIDTNSLASMVYDADVYLVICFNKSNVSFKNKVRRDLKENVLPECFANVVLTDADAKQISSELGIKDKSIPHLYTVDKSGLITHYTSGLYSDRKFEKLTEYLEID